MDSQRFRRSANVPLNKQAAIKYLQNQKLAANITNWGGVEERRGFCSHL